jgi:hypothetical protein
VKAWVFYAVVCSAVSTAVVQPASAQALRAKSRIAITDDASGVAVTLLDRAGPLRVGVAIRLETDDPAAATLEPRLATLERRRTDLWLAVAAPSTSAAVEPWRLALAGIVNRRASTLVTLEVVVDDQPLDVAAYAVQVAATVTRARRPDVRIALGGRAVADQSRWSAIYTQALAPYLDVAVVNRAAAAALLPSFRQVDADVKLAVIDDEPPVAGSDLPRRVVDDVLEAAGTDVVLQAWPARDLTPAALQALDRLAPILTGDIEPLDTTAARPTLTIAGRDAADAVRYRLLFDTRTFSTFLVYWGQLGPEPMRVALTLPIGGIPTVHNLESGAHAAAADYVRNSSTGDVQLTVPLTGAPMLVDFNEGASEVAAERSGVSAEAPLSVNEIIARHQQAQAAQDGLVHNYVASARMRQHFRPTVTDPGYDVVTENRYFVEGAAVEWEELSFSVNGSKWEEDRPPFPLLQPEKVLSLPLQLRFDEGYRYSLEGTEKVDGVECYAVRFEPVRRDESLYRGTVWIDRRTFARVRVRAVQSGLPAPVVSNEETLHYVQAATLENRPIFLFGGMTARQIVLVAGRNLLIEKEVSFSGFRVNDAGFDAARAEARRSDRIMYRETERGLRYYVKQGESRVVSENPTTHVKAMAMGVYVDPSYAFPLPIFGINYLNFGFGSSGKQQLALLFGGVLLAGNVQRPKLGSTPFDASVDFFAIAAPSSDRLYRGAGEAETERVLTWPMSTGLNLGWQATPYQKAALQYQLRFDAYVRDRTTAESFQPPSSTLTNGIGAAWEYRRGGYNVTANATWFARSRWRDWGPASAPVAADASRTYAKYSVGGSRTILVGPFQTLYFNGNWFGGRHLDRFVQYQFGMFEDTKIHGVPSSGVRFSELAMARGTYSLNIFEQYRLDVFLEHAWGRDDEPGAAWQPIPAVGTAVNFRAFWNTILRAEAGHSLLPARYDGLGSTTLQVLLLKPLR